MKVSWDDDIPNIWENKKCSKPPTRNSKYCNLVIVWFPTEPVETPDFPNLMHKLEPRLLFTASVNTSFTRNLFLHTQRRIYPQTYDCQKNGEDEIE